MIIEVREARHLGNYRLRVEFSDDTVGERDFTFLARESGPMVEPLRDPVYFARVFVEDGVLTWPNGFDLDPIALHDEMKQAGELRSTGDAAE
ncbi:MAG TPA: DUF2442 domain-containing protein [Xanthobacteraceae bacterium]|nr:DUF2442 domain-containing protein [Xanthobacteraceae bacterium]